MRLCRLPQRWSMVQPEPFFTESWQAGPALANLEQPWRTRVLVSQALYAIKEFILLRLHWSEHAACLHPCCCLCSFAYLMPTPPCLCSGFSAADATQLCWFQPDCQTCFVILSSVLLPIQTFVCV